jgi:hypothetical protein
MGSVNNIYLVIADEPYKRYVKTIASKVGGVRMDDQMKGQTGFILESAPDGFSYEAEVLEIYSDREDRLLRQANKTLFSNGYLKEFTGQLPELDTTNMLDDDEVDMIAATKNIQVLQKRINELTSPFTVKRILDKANEIGRPQKTIAVIQDRLDFLSK